MYSSMFVSIYFTKLSIPDSLIDDFYLYVSGYQGHNPIKLNHQKKLKQGIYYDNGWKGFALPLVNLDKNAALLFFKDAIDRYQN